jgi:hypothetical protein
MPQDFGRIEQAIRAPVECSPRLGQPPIITNVISDNLLKVSDSSRFKLSITLILSLKSTFLDISASLYARCNFPENLSHSSVFGTRPGGCPCFILHR